MKQVLNSEQNRTHLAKYVGLDVGLGYVNFIGLRSNIISYFKDNVQN